jgi:hypothetical protein
MVALAARLRSARAGKTVIWKRTIILFFRRQVFGRGIAFIRRP